LSNPRIIGGSARGIRLEMVPGNITRPITDRTKAALFNIIGADIQKARFLDLFGGTGSVGIEALSRGASFARFLEISQSAVKVIKNNLEKTKLSDLADVIRTDALSYLSSRGKERFDYIYIAPPQYKNLWIKVLQQLEINQSHLNKDAWVIVQIDPIEKEDLKFDHLDLFDERRYGNTLLLFYLNK
jgi:16S rRNA (guanine966-N2)-methyltransferase